MQTKPGRSLISTRDSPSVFSPFTPVIHQPAQKKSRSQGSRDWVYLLIRPKTTQLHKGSIMILKIIWCRVDKKPYQRLSFRGGQSPVLLLSCFQHPVESFYIGPHLRNDHLNGNHFEYGKDGPTDHDIVNHWYKIVYK